MTDLPEFLVDYLIKRDSARADAVNEFFGKLTDRERALVKDAAVMGYICGMTHPKGDPYPGDGSAVVQVIEGCQALPDLYPAVSALLLYSYGSVDYFLQTLQPFGEWEQSSAPIPTLEEALRRLALRRSKRPDDQTRLVKRTPGTSVEVVPEAES